MVAAFSWRFAWTQGLGWLAGNNAPLTERWPSLWIILLAEVWKTVPFMALLLMAGLALVPEDLLKAASMDGAIGLAAVLADHGPADQALDPGRAAVPHARRLPNIRQHLRAHERGEQDASVSIVAYDNLIRGLNLGIGSTMAVLIFLTTAIIAFIFIKLFGAAAPGQD